MITLIFLWVIVCGIAGALIAQSKNIPPLSGATVGVLLGPIGLLILACLSKRAEESA